jgi:hypothetical protein
MLHQLGDYPIRRFHFMPAHEVRPYSWRRTCEFDFRPLPGRHVLPRLHLRFLRVWADLQWRTAPGVSWGAESEAVRLSLTPEFGGFGASNGGKASTCLGESHDLIRSPLKEAFRSGTKGQRAETGPARQRIHRIFRRESTFPTSCFSKVLNYFFNASIHHCDF